MATAIEVTGLIKSFGRTRALDGLKLSVRTGEVHGFLGPNGAGKTTTIRVPLGLGHHIEKRKTMATGRTIRTPANASSALWIGDIGASSWMERRGSYHQGL